MKKSILLLLIVVTIGLSGCTQPIEQEVQITATETAAVKSYDLNGDGVLTDSEYQTCIKRMTEGVGSVEAEESEEAINEATAITSDFDTDEDGDLSYEESLSIMQKIYEKYDNNEITDPNIRTILANFEKKVNELNGYYDLLEEVGVKGPKHKIELRK